MATFGGPQRRDVYGAASARNPDMAASLSAQMPPRDFLKQQPKLITLKLFPKGSELPLLQAQKAREAYRKHLTAIEAAANEGLSNRCCIQGAQDLLRQGMDEVWLRWDEYEVAIKIILIAQAILSGEVLLWPPDKKGQWISDQFNTLESLQEKKVGVPENWQAGIESIKSQLYAHIDEDQTSAAEGISSEEPNPTNLDPSQSPEALAESEDLDDDWATSYLAIEEREEAELLAQEKSRRIRLLQDLVESLAFSNEPSLDASRQEALSSALLEGASASGSDDPLHILFIQVFQKSYMASHFDETIRYLCHLSQVASNPETYKPPLANNQWLVNCLTLLGRAYFRINDFKTAQAVFLEALHKKDASGQRLSVCFEHRIMARLAIVYLHLEEREEALFYAILSADHFKVCAGRDYQKDFDALRYLGFWFSAHASKKVQAAAAQLSWLAGAKERNAFFLEAGKLSFALAQDYYKRANAQREIDVGGKKAYTEKLMKGERILSSPKEKVLREKSQRFFSASFSFFANVWSCVRSPSQVDEKSLPENSYIEEMMAICLLHLGRDKKVEEAEGFYLENFVLQVKSYSPVLSEVLSFVHAAWLCDLTKLKRSRVQLYRHATGALLNEDSPNYAELKRLEPKLREFFNQFDGERGLITGFFRMYFFSPIEKLLAQAQQRSKDK